MKKKKEKSTTEEHCLGSMGRMSVLPTHCPRSFFSFVLAVDLEVEARKER